MPVLQGAQGIYKSTALCILAGGKDFYFEVSSVKDVNDLMRLGSRVWVVEISEMAAYSKLDQEHFKTWLSAPYDAFIDKFDKQPTHRPKGYVVLGSTNPEQVLRDTENRRYLPVRLASIDTDRLERDREQLFAEAYVLYKRIKHPWYDVENAKAEQEKHRIKPDWLDDLEEALDRITNPAAPPLPTYNGKPVITMKFLMQLGRAMGDMRTHARSRHG
jgi:predicted P-loop ATPase